MHNVIFIFSEDKKQSYAKMMIAEHRDVDLVKHLFRCNHRVESGYAIVMDEAHPEYERLEKSFES
jgi:hypothetical protein